MNTRCLRFVAAFALIAGIACEDDDPVMPVIPPPQYKDLTQREHVLFNLELSHNQRRVSRYDQLLDADFVFYPAPGDVGGEIPPQWNRAEEIDLHTRLFDKNYTGQYACQSIDMDVRFEEGVAWDGSMAPNGETWHTARVNYDFTFEVAPDYYVSQPGSTADFTVRNAGTDDAPLWQLVAMRDRGLDMLLRAPSQATRQSTWGAVKAIYR